MNWTRSKIVQSGHKSSHTTDTNDRMLMVMSLKYYPATGLRIVEGVIVRRYTCSLGPIASNNLVHPYLDPAH